VVVDDEPVEGVGRCPLAGLPLAVEGELALDAGVGDALWQDVGVPKLLPDLEEIGRGHGRRQLPGEVPVGRPAGSVEGVQVALDEAVGFPTGLEGVRGDARHELEVDLLVGVGALAEQVDAAPGVFALFLRSH